MKKFTIIQYVTKKIYWDVEAEDKQDAEDKTIHVDAEPTHTKIISSEWETIEDD